MVTSALLDAGANISVILEKFLGSLPHTPQLLKACMHKVMSASRDIIGQIGQCDLTFRLGNKQFTDMFISL